MSSPLGRRLVAAARIARWEATVEAAVDRAIGRRRAHANMALRASAPPDAFGTDTWDGDVDAEVGPVIDAILAEVVAGNIGAFGQLSPEQRARILGIIDVETQRDAFLSLVKSIGPDVARRLHDELAIAVGRGEGIDDMARRIAKVFDIAENRARTIARTEVLRASNAAGYDTAAAIHAEMPLVKTWIATGGRGSRPEHNALDGETIPFDDTFDVDGEDADYPLDPALSAANSVNCRCTMSVEAAEG